MYFIIKYLQDQQFFHNIPPFPGFLSKRHPSPIWILLYPGIYLPQLCTLNLGILEFKFIQYLMRLKKNLESFSNLLCEGAKLQYILIHWLSRHQVVFGDQR